MYDLEVTTASPEYEAVFLNYIHGRSLSDDETELLRRFLPNDDQEFSDQEPESESESEWYQVPESWDQVIKDAIIEQSVILSEVRLRRTIANRVIQPVLVSGFPLAVSVGGEQEISSDDYSQLIIVLIRKDDVLVVNADGLLDKIVDQEVPLIADIYDRGIVSGNAFCLGVTQKRVTGHPSEGMHSMGGYIELPDYSGDAIATALMHLPKPYRKRAKWCVDVNIEDKIRPLMEGEMLNKLPVIFHKSMDPQYPIILGDWTRGYCAGSRVFYIHRESDSKFSFRYSIGGDVVFETAFKVLRSNLGV